MLPLKFQKGFHPIMMCSVGYSPKAVLRILKQPKSRDGVKSHYYKGLFTNYVDKILAIFDHLPSFIDILYGMNVDKIGHFWTTYLVL